MNRQIKEFIVCGMLSACVSFVCCVCNLMEPLDTREDQSAAGFVYTVTHHAVI